MIILLFFRKTSKQKVHFDSILNNFVEKDAKKHLVIFHSAFYIWEKKNINFSH